MSNKTEGTLFFDPESGRYDIRFGMDSFYGGLHCGECFEVKVNNTWVPVRIEMGDDWYLVACCKTVGTYSTDVGGVNGSRERKSV